MLILSFLEYSAIVIGVIAMAGGKAFGLLKAYHLGIFLIGAGISLGGLDSLFSRQVRFPSFIDRRDSYAGAPAVIWGLMVLVVGIAVIAMAYLQVQGLSGTVPGYLKRHPAAAMVVLGLLAAGAGALLMFNPHGWRGVWWTLLVRVPRMTVGLILLAGGLAAAGLGVWQWFEPQAFDHFFRSAGVRFDSRTWSRLWRELPGLRR